MFLSDEIKLIDLDYFYICRLLQEDNINNKTLNNTMQEKYFIINLTNQIYLILRCSQQKLDNYLNYGIKLITNNHNSIVIDRLSDWLVFHSIHFRAEKIPTKNPFTFSVFSINALTPSIDSLLA